MKIYHIFTIWPHRKGLLKIFCLASLVLLFSQCFREDDLTSPNDQQVPEPVKSLYQIEGLDDSLSKQYEAYTYFDIDTASDGEIVSVLYTPRLEVEDKDELEATIFIEEAFQEKIYQENEETFEHELISAINFDSTTYAIEHGTMEVKGIDKNTISVSLNIVYFKLPLKRYRLTSSNIIATYKKF